MKKKISIIEKFLKDLYPINRSITGKGTEQTLLYIKKNFLPKANIKSIQSGKKVYDWIIPPEWNVSEAYIKNKYGEKIIDIKNNNLHIVSYSNSINRKISKKELLKKIYTLPNNPEWIPYRTSYYKKDWGFCCSHNLLKSEKFVGPFQVYIKSEFNKKGKLNWLEIKKQGKIDDEILISSYCCHPSLANDNLSGIVASVLLFKYLQQIKTKYSYRLVVLPETIGALSFLSQVKQSKIIAGMIMSCLAGPGKFSIKEGFDKDHWINSAAHLSLKNKTKDDYITYNFEPNGSDERQYSTPGFRIVTPSIHKSKYYEYPEYHTSADNLEFISPENLYNTLEIYKDWIRNIESFCIPKSIMMFGEYQLSVRNLYPNLGGTISQITHKENVKGFKNRKFKFKGISLTGDHLEGFQWLMHLSDGSKSNIDIAKISNINLNIINDCIEIFKQKKLIKI